VEAEAHGDLLQADLNKALTAVTNSEVSILRGMLHTATRELHIFLQWCRQAWESIGLGWLDLPPRTIADGRSQFLPQLVVLAEWLEELGDTIQEAIVAGSQKLATKVVEHILASLKSQLPNMPLEMALDGIIPGNKEMACKQFRGLAADVVAMFVPTTYDALPADGDGGPAGPDPPEEGEPDASSDAGQ
jgi:hypothetical protein